VIYARAISSRNRSATTAGMGLSPDSHRRTVRSSRQSTSRAKARALSPDRAMACSSSSRSDIGPYEHAVGGDVTALLVDFLPRLEGVEAGGPLRRLGFRGEPLAALAAKDVREADGVTRGGLADLVAAHGRLRSVSDLIALTEISIGQLPYGVKGAW
jgi:hypothetical protein